MTPKPTGRRSSTAPDELLLTRSFKASIENVWASITEPERTAQWFASWRGEAGPGQTIRYRLEFEEDAPEADMVIDVCEPPHRLVVSTDDDQGHWRLEARLRETDGVTRLELVHHLEDDAALGEIGPGWEYYLDMLVAAREGLPRPDFEDYYPAQKDFYDSLRRVR